MGAYAAIGEVKCPHCNKLITRDHSYTWCTKCGEPLPENIITLIQSFAKAAPKNDAKPDWSQKPRSGLWKFTASLIWVVACIGGAALFIYSEFSRANALHGDEQSQAIFESIMNLQKVIVPGTVIVLIAGVVYFCKRPGLNRLK